MDFEDGPVWIDPGEAIVVPHGVEPRPHADEEVALLVFDPFGSIVHRAPHPSRSMPTTQSRGPRLAATFSSPVLRRVAPGKTHKR
jgi:hypothetical protein